MSNKHNSPNEPDRLYIGKKDREIYNEILSNSIFKGKENKEIFFLAVVIGLKKGVRTPIKGSKEGYILTTYLNDNDKIIMNAIAVKEKGNLDILENKKEVFEIVEEYAHTGIIILRGLVSEKDGGLFLKKFEAYLRESLPKNIKK